MSKKEELKAIELARMPDGSGLVTEHIGDDLTIVAKGPGLKVQAKLTSLDIQDKNWIITPISAAQEGEEVVVKFMGHNKGKGNVKNLQKLLKTFDLKLINWEIKHNFKETVIPPWLMNK